MAPNILWLVAASLQSLPPFHMVPDLLLTYLSVSPPLTRISVIGFNPSCPKSWIISPWDLWLMASANILFSSMFMFWGSTWTWISTHCTSLYPYPIPSPFVVTSPFDSHPIVWLSFQQRDVTHCGTSRELQKCKAITSCCPLPLLWEPCVWLSRDLEKQGAAHLMGS